MFSSAECERSIYSSVRETLYLSRRGLWLENGQRKPYP